MRWLSFLCCLSAATLAAPPALGQPEARPEAPVAPQILEHVDPEYPPERLAEGIDTTVTLFVTVEKDGTVSDAVVAESGGAAFDDAAMKAVRRWRFSPAMRGGAPLRARIRVPFHFAPGPHEQEPAPAPAEAPEAEAADHPAAPPPPRPAAPKPVEFAGGVAGPHAVAEPGKPIEIHVQGRPNPPRRAASDFRIGRAALAAAPHTTAADLLRTAPGVHVAHPEGEAVAQRIFLRGFDAEHGQDVELRVGPIPLNQRSHVHGQGYADLGVIIPEVVRSLRVVEGVYDPQQGDFAVAGSAYFDLGVEERGLQLKGALGSFGARRLLAVWAPEAQSEDTFGAAVVRATDGFGDGTRGAISGGAVGQYRVPLPDEYSALLHVAAHGGRANLAGVLRRDDIEAGRVGFHDAYPDLAARAQSAASTRLQLALGVERSDDDGSQKSAWLWAATSGYRSRMNFTGYTQRSRRRPEWVGRGDLVEQSNQDAAIGGGLAYRTPRIPIAPWLTGQVAVGAEVQTSGVDQAQNLLQPPQNETWDQRVDASIQVTGVGAHADALLELSRHARLRGGLRADLLVFDVDDRIGNFIPAAQKETHIEGFRRTAAGLAAGPRVTLEIDPLPALRVSASYGHGYRSPQARLLEDGDNAPFATVKSYEAGATLRPGGGLSVTAAAYETRLSYDLAFDAAEGALVRIGRTTRRGLVAYLQAAPSPALTAGVSATFVHATLDEPPPPTPENPSPPYVKGQQLPFVPPVVVRADLALKRPLFTIAGAPVEGRLGYGATFLSPRPLPYAQTAAPVFVVDASLSLRRSLRVGRDAEQGGPWIEVGVEAQNLLDAEYADAEYSFKSTWPGAAGASRPSIPSELPARHISAGSPRSLLANVTLSL
ncbi:TonB family protein [Sorangium sp. So ce426]|uniref:TonB family protein n=1 Tax=Sorangium sp. So ce426 TaxID=3133312 RepID=UPI003F5B83E2